ncbi:hypothetical protein AB0G82_38940, partial [Streptomyces anulatus]
MAAHSVVGDSTTRRASPLDLSSSTVPLATIEPALTMPTLSHSRSTRSSWWLENTTGTPADAELRAAVEELTARLRDLTAHLTPDQA